MDRSALFITGVGSISALGCEEETRSGHYVAGRSLLSTRNVGTQRLPIGALPPLAEQALVEFIGSRPRYRRLDRSVQLALFAAREAFHAAGLTALDESAALGVLVGSSRGATGLFERYYEGFVTNPGERLSPLTSPTTTLGCIASWVAQEVQASGPCAEFSSTCSTSIYAIGTAMAWLRSGMAKRFIAGGAEAPLTTFTLAQMQALGIYSARIDEELPCRSCHHPDGRGDTMVLGEGACLLVLEALTANELDARAAAPLGRILGAGFFVEPISSPTSLSKDGEALYRSMSAALADAALPSVDLIVTHTPGTAGGDEAELRAVERLFGAAPPLLTSNKWLIGHTLGASGALSVDYALRILATGKYLEYPYPVAFENRPRPIATVMINSVGFGGNAGSLIVGRPNSVQ